MQAVREEEKMKRVGDTIVCVDRTLLTIRENGDLEIRGVGWEGRRKGDTPMTDRPRVCRFGCRNRAEQIAEMLAGMLDEIALGNCKPCLHSVSVSKPDGRAG